MRLIFVDTAAFIALGNQRDDLHKPACHIQKQLAKDINLDDLLKQSAKIVQIDLDKCVQAKRLHGIDKHKRDLIIYFLWNKGLMTNEQLGRLFNISYSAISHSVKIFKAKMINDKKVKNQFNKINSQFKL